MKPLANGLLPTSTTNLNSHLAATGVPASHSAFSRSIHDFTRIVLGVETARSNLPPLPPQSQLSGFQNRASDSYDSREIFTSFRSYLSERNPSELEVAGRLKTIPIICRKFFVDDLAALDLHHVSFAWQESPASPYNDWFSTTVLKHWSFAKNNGLLHNYAISPTEDTIENARMVLFRWIQGRQGELRLSSREPNWRQIKAAREKKSKRRKQVRVSFTFT